jgi:FkbM family methyltransferase
VGYHLGESADASKNGEFRLIDGLAQQCHTFVDVGANVGNWTEYFLHRNLTPGLLFEPSEQCISLLKTKFKDKPVTLRNVAVGDRSGFVSFVEEQNCGQGSSASETYFSLSGTSRRVPMVTLDQELPGFAADIDFLKIDTEGYDLKVLKGAKTLLKDRRIRFIQFEYNAHWLAVGSSLAEAQRFLEKMGFRLLLIRSTGLHPLSYSLWGDYFRYSNFLAYRDQDQSLIENLLGQKM